MERAVNNFYDPAGPQIAASGSMQPRPMSSAPGKGTKRAAASKPSAKSGAAKKLKGAPRISGSFFSFQKVCKLPSWPLWCMRTGVWQHDRAK